MNISIIGSLDEVSPEEWNTLTGNQNYPFVRYEFLSALEHHGCVGERYGWFPQHIILRDELQTEKNPDGKLIGAVPMYIKTNSYGEFVFDWAWADAYQRAGLEYYPKLVIGIPYTPATGPRLLSLQGSDRRHIEKLLIQGAIDHAKSIGVSSLHCLFTDDKTTAYIEDQGMMARMDCQFHWHNDSYLSFEEFLESFSSKKRKKVKRERRRVEESDVEIITLRGEDITSDHWDAFHHFYQIPFFTKSGTPTLSLKFFKEIGQTMPENILLFLAIHENRYVAAALDFYSDKVLYGRHWGSNTHFHSLHFELCYYRGIEFCIEQGLERFEPGAQGEHKINRGFLPTATHSTHWLSHPEFRSAIDDFLTREVRAIQHHIEILEEHSPYKNTKTSDKPVESPGSPFKSITS